MEAALSLAAGRLLPAAVPVVGRAAPPDRIATAPRRRPRRGRGGGGWRPHRAVDRLLPGRGRPDPAHRRPGTGGGRLRGLGTQWRVGAPPCSRCPTQRLAAMAGRTRPWPCAGRWRRPSRRSAACVRSEPIECGFAKGGRWCWPGPVSSSSGPATRWPRPGPGASTRRTSGSCRPPRPRPWSAATDVLGGTYTPHCAAVDPARWYGDWPGPWSAGGRPSTSRPRCTPSAPGRRRPPGGG